MSEQRPYQAEGTRFLLDRERAVLADEPGVGKTNQLLLAAQGRTLVLSPAILQDVWTEEMAVWNPDADLYWGSYSSICKRVDTGKKSKTGNPIYNVVAVPRDELASQWDTIIADEAHYLKGRTTTWTKAAAKIKTKRLYLATGTPLPGWGHEIFMFLRFLFPGDRRFTNYWGWVDEYFKTWKPPYGGTEIRGLRRGFTWYSVAQEWGLDERWLRRTLDEVLPELPPMTTQTIRVPMVPAQKAVYQRLKKDWMAVLPDTGHEIVSWNDGGIHQKLLQCSTGLPTLHPGETGGSGKLDAVRELMAERDHPTILFCAYIDTAEAVANLVYKMGRQVGVVSSKYTINERRDAINAFRDGTYDVLVGTVGTLSEGVTLTRADTCIFVERSPRPNINEQARRRIRRFGQDRPTLAIDLVTEGTVDEALSALLVEKAKDSTLALTGFQLAALKQPQAARSSVEC